MPRGNKKSNATTRWIQSLNSSDKGLHIRSATLYRALQNRSKEPNALPARISFLEFLIVGASEELVKYCKDNQLQCHEIYITGLLLKAKEQVFRDEDLADKMLNIVVEFDELCK